tara:strand:- start:328 stop:507 length:180 start_codon:yes stop_codon:yes gene_type:complete
MDKSLVDILACPVCKGELSLAVTEEVKNDVISGKLFCSSCKEDYQISDSIPNLLPHNLQ